MKLCFLEHRADGTQAFFDFEAGRVLSYCASARKRKGSKCLEHYQRLLKGSDARPIDFFRCPYGLVTTGPITFNGVRRIFYGLWTNELGGKELDDGLREEASTTEGDVRAYVDLLIRLVDETKEFESHIFEAAIHDVRHLNQAIANHAEQLLAKFGYRQNEEWDIDQIRKDESHWRTLTIYGASRDLSMAISIHEVARDPAQASAHQREQFKFHKAFYRQKRISAERLAYRNLRVNIQGTNAIRPLTKSFGLIPKLLIDNASKYANANTEIGINFVEVRGFFNIECINYGPIIRDDELTKVFNRGQRGSNRSGIEGHGIGLWLAKLIVESNGGTIKMVTSPDGARDMSGRKLGTTRVVISL